MAIATFLLWMFVGWILVASAAYYGAMQALRMFFDEHADGEVRVRVETLTYHRVATAR